MANPTENHDYEVPQQGETDWHVPLNENIRSLETDVELRGQASSRTNYTPVAGAKYFATDTGRVFIGDGTDWIPVLSTGQTPVVEQLVVSGQNPAIYFESGYPQQYPGPAAYGTVNEDASLAAGTSNVSVSWDSNNSRYEISFDGFEFDSRSDVAQVSLMNIYSPEYSARAASAGDNLVVYIYDGNGNEVKDPFYFTVLKP